LTNDAYFDVSQAYGESFLSAKGNRKRLCSV
jgi:hypothetical protein